eukprot:176905_1
MAAVKETKDKPITPNAPFESTAQSVEATSQIDYDQCRKCRIKLGSNNRITVTSAIGNYGVVGQPLPDNDCPGGGAHDIHPIQVIQRLVPDRPETQSLTTDDIQYIKYQRLVQPFMVSVIEMYASNTNTSTASKSEETKSVDNDDDVEYEYVSKTKKQKKLLREKAKKLRFGQNPSKLYCSISGDEVSAADDKTLRNEDPDKITCAHLLPSGCMGNINILALLNRGYDDKFDPHSPRNMLFLRNKYTTAMDERKMSLKWNEEVGYTVYVVPKHRALFPNIHGRPLQIYDKGSLNTNKYDQSYPYRRASAWHLALTQQQIPQFFEAMKRASMNEASKMNETKPMATDTDSDQ